MTNETSNRNWWDEPPATPELEGLPRYVIKHLAAANITTMQQIKDAGEQNLLRVPRIGGAAVRKIKQWLRDQRR